MKLFQSIFKTFFNNKSGNFVTYVISIGLAKDEILMTKH
jgi:hypothetical protein